jgi:O-antigen/teichoic acid export membrane protein
MAPRVSVRRNILANYASQIYGMAVGVVMAPVYLSYMGKEAYGLIGFFTMMTSWFQLLDMGLTPTLARETARFRAGAIGIDALRAHMRALEAVFGAVAMLGALVLVLLSREIAVSWLKVGSLRIEEVADAVMLMGLAAPLRWMSGLYRGVVNGFERQVWLSGYNIAVSTARFVGVLAVFAAMGATPVNFFSYQLAVAVLELAGLMIATYALVRRGAGPRRKFSWDPLRRNLAFSLAIAFSATVWVVVSQTDRLILSKLLPLAQYGVFSIAVVAATAINAANGPFNLALMPRLTKLVAERNDAGIASLYSRSTQAAVTLLAPAVVLLAFFAEKVLEAWTGDAAIAAQAAPILCLYAIGYGAVSLHSFVYYIQYAHGDLKLHFIGHALLLAFLVPAYLLLAPRYGAAGTGAAWAAANGLYALFWIPVVHARFFTGRHWRWMTRDVLAIVVPTVLAGWILSRVAVWPHGRIAMCAMAALLALVLLAVSCAGSTVVRAEVFRRARALAGT